MKKPDLLLANKRCPACCFSDKCRLEIIIPRACLDGTEMILGVPGLTCGGGRNGELLKTHKDPNIRNNGINLFVALVIFAGEG